MPRPRPRQRRGLTLVECAMSIAIVGLSLAAVMQAFVASTQSNLHAKRETAGLLLATHVRELMADLPINDPVFGADSFGAESGEALATYDDVDDLDGKRFSPPIDAARRAIAGMAEYAQRVRVDAVQTDDLDVNTDGTALKTTRNGAVRVTVTVTHGGARDVASLSWIKVVDP